MASEQTDAERLHTVAPGETLYRIAVNHRPEGVSLDQMLVGLFRANPEAFLGRNMNRLKAGSVLRLPTAEQAAEVMGDEARGLIRAQSADFDAYRQRLAAVAPRAPDAGPGRRITGQVQAEVKDERRPAEASPDQLRLSRGGAAEATRTEATLSQQAEAKAAAEREAELQRNLEALRRLQSAVAPASPGSSAPPPKAAPLAAPQGAAPAEAGSSTAGTGSPGGAGASPPAGGPVAGPAPSSPLTVDLAAPVTGPSPAAAPAGAPAEVPKSPPADPAAPASDSGLSMERLLEAAMPYSVPAAGALVAALAALAVAGLVRARRRAASRRLAPEGAAPPTFGGSSTFMGGDSAFDDGAPAPVASEAEALRQLGALGDVDPVAEAEVYLAYGRDRQAEEILREAMRAAPQRLDVPAKLLEIYARRGDVEAFLPVAQRVYEATDGASEPWPQVQALGRSLAPQHPLFSAGAAEGSARAPALEEASAPGAGSAVVDLALDAAPAAAPAVALDRDPVSDLAGSASSASAAEIWPPEPSPPLGTEQAADVPDLSEPEGVEADPLQRKLALADEFMQIGDADAARDLLNEVLAGGPEDLQAQARERLDRLG